MMDPLMYASVCVCVWKLKGDSKREFKIEEMDGRFWFTLTDVYNPHGIESHFDTKIGTT